MRQTALLQAKNAFEILSRLPKHGLGSRLSRTSWGDDSFWTVAKVKVSPDGKHGTAWGTLTWKGQPQQAEAAVQIRGPLKPVWRLLQEGSSQPEWKSELAAALRQERQAAAAAEAAEAQPAAAGEASASA